MNKKYELTDETINISGHILHRIRAIKPFGNVKLGDLGGFIESEKNLEQEGSCWIYGDAQVFDRARVSNNAQISGNAIVSGNARVYGDAQVSNNALVSSHSKIYGDAQLCEEVWASGDADISGDTQLFGRARIFGKTKLDSGIWNKTIEVDDRYYLISTTLKKILMEW